MASGRVPKTVRIFIQKSFSIFNRVNTGKIYAPHKSNSPILKLNSDLEKRMKPLVSYRDGKR